MALSLTSCSSCGERDRGTPSANDADVSDASSPDAGGVEDSGARDTSELDLVDLPPPTCVDLGCPDPTLPHCDPITGACGECIEDAQCMDSLAPICRAGSCAPCQTDGECQAAALQPICGADGRCVTCETDDECAGGTPVCDVVAGECQECGESLDCGVTMPACTDGACTSCATNGACTPEDLAREVLGVFCRNGAWLEGRYEDVQFVEETIAAQQALACLGDASFDPERFGLIVDAIVDGRVVVDETALSNCTSSEPGQCGGVDLLVPAVMDGNACLADFECVSGICDLSTCPGTCEARVAPGGACAGDADCRTSLTCIAGLCQELPAENETCETRCVGTLWCDAGTCAARLPAGGTCTANSQCESSICDSNSGTCAALPGPGEPCPRIGGVCVDGGRCWQGVCQDPQPVGGTCNVTAQCAAGLRCVDMSCVQILLPGEACQKTAHCALGFACLDGYCRALPDIGEACAPNTGCVRGDCNPDAAVCVNMGVGDSCGVRSSYPYDLFDPCGDTSTCTDDGQNVNCIADSGEGALCGPMRGACASGTNCKVNDGNEYVCQMVCGPDSL